MKNDHPDVGSYDCVQIVFKLDDSPKDQIRKRKTRNIMAEEFYVPEEQGDLQLLKSVLHT